jgi:hypothetical protein
VLIPGERNGSGLALIVLCPLRFLAADQFPLSQFLLSAFPFEPRYLGCHEVLKEVQ